MSAVLVDTNLLLLLIVGEADTSYVSKHKRLRDHYTATDFNLVKDIIDQYDEHVILPHILAEVSSLLQMIADPALTKIRHTLCRLLTETWIEFTPDSQAGCHRSEYHRRGLTDALILHTCATWSEQGLRLDFITADEPLYNDVLSLGYPAELY